jgi:hypothetical protein
MILLSSGLWRPPPDTRPEPGSSARAVTLGGTSKPLRSKDESLIM